MKTILFLASLPLALLVMGMLAIGGCGTAIHENIAYFYPNWMVDGRIIAVKSFSTHRYEGLPGYGRDITISSGNYLVTMKDDGSDEKIIYGGENIGDDNPVASPLGNYVACSSGKNLRIITADGAREIKTINCNENLNSFDWSPDETKIAFSGADTKNLYILNINNETITKIATNSADVAWRVGDKIAFGFLYTINSDGSNNNYLTDGGKPQILNSGKVLYFADFVSSGIYKIKSLYTTGTGEATSINAYERGTLKLSFDNKKIVGGDSSQGGFPSGIWVINIDGTNQRKLRD
ncbi:MAG: hypothetical protein WC645_00050 [Candidatus Margulisiibacteriota bacterium]